MTMPGDERGWRDSEIAVCMGMDAMRIAMGLPLKNFTYEQVMRWLRVMKK